MHTRILLKIFARTFYKINAGLFLFLFLILFGVVEPSQWIGYQRSLMLSFVSKPFFLFILFAVWLFYVIKILHHTISRLFLPQQQFLFYSITLFKRTIQFKSWFWVQLIMALPVVIYGLLTAVTGFYYHYYMEALGILFYLIFLLLCASYICLYFVNNKLENGGQTILFKIFRRWQKPLFSLYIYHIFDKLKVSLTVTKICSYLILTVVFPFFADDTSDINAAGICVLIIITAHVILIYRLHRFNNKYMNFVLNLPYRRYMLFANFLIIFFVLLIPEGIWFFTHLNFSNAAGLYLLAMSTAQLFYTIAYHAEANMSAYLKWIFAIFLILFYPLISGFIWEVTGINLIISFLLFNSASTTD